MFLLQETLSKGKPQIPQVKLSKAKGGQKEE